MGVGEMGLTRTNSKICHAIRYVCTCTKYTEFIKMCFHKVRGHEYVPFSCDKGK